jgi:hypothetical protein
VTVADMVSEVEAAGVAFLLDGEKVHVRYPDDQRRKELAGQIALLRAQRVEVAAYLKARRAIPPIPDGVRLIRWEPKPAPVILTRYEVVTEVSRFVEMTLLELRAAIAGRSYLAGHRGVRELMERLEECGVVVEVDEAAACSDNQCPERLNPERLKRTK